MLPFCLGVWQKNSGIASNLLSRLFSRGDTKHSQIMLFCVILQLLEGARDVFHVLRECGCFKRKAQNPLETMKRQSSEIILRDAHLCFIGVFSTNPPTPHCGKLPNQQWLSVVTGRPSRLRRRGCLANAGSIHQLHRELWHPGEGDLGHPKWRGFLMGKKTS